MAGLYSTSDYAQALRNLLPRGKAWNSAEDGSVQASLLDGLAAGFANLDAGAQALLTDAFPSTAVFLLPQWEAALGLPDPCAGTSPTLQGRQAQVAARFANFGGQTPAFITAFAQALGFEISVQECAPFRMGQQSMGSPLGGPEWAHAFVVVSLLGLTETSFRMGQSGMGEPLESWGNSVLECEINAVKPAHTSVIFEYP